MTAKKAVNIGHILVNAPVVAIILGYIYIGTRVMEGMGLSFWWFFPSFATVLAIALLYWSIVAPRWLVWAYQNVSNKKELKERAIEGKLVWEDGHFLGKRMILTQKDKLIIAQAEKEMGNGEASSMEPSDKFLILYMHRGIFWTTFIFQVVLVIVSIACIIIGLFPFDKFMFFLGIILGVLFVPTWFMKVPIMENKEAFWTIIKRYFSKEIQLEINDTGISARAVRTGLIEWKALENFNTIPTFFGRVEKLFLSYWDEEEELKFVEIPFGYFSIDQVTLRRLIDYHCSRNNNQEDD